jgi:hypothetical protein
MFKKLILLIFILPLFISLYCAQQNNDIEDILDHWFDKDDYYGIIYSRPIGKEGIWEIGKKKFNIVSSTKIDEEDANMEIGVCVEVEFKNGQLVELETADIRKCQKSISKFF